MESCGVRVLNGDPTKEMQTAAREVKLCDNLGAPEQADLLWSPLLDPGLQRPPLAIWGWKVMLHPLLLLIQVTFLAVLGGTT